MNKALPTAIGAAFMALGVGGLVAPKSSSYGFGLPTEEPTALGYLRAAAARDIVLGTLVLTSLDEPKTLARIFACSTIAALSDMLVLGGLRGLRIQHLTHASGVVALALAAKALGEGTEPPKSD